MLEDRIVSVPGSSPEVVGFESLAAELRSLGIGFGKDRYLPKIQELIAGLEMRLTSDVQATEDDYSGKSRKHYLGRLQAAAELHRLLEALLEIIRVNLAGKFLREGFAAILLSRILTPFATGFVDLQSPTGAGINGVVYDYNGDVYPSDESRMLAKMGDGRFLMGNVKRDTYLSIFRSAVLEELVDSSCVETLPGCHACALQTYCGADPVRNYTLQGDIVGYRPTSEFCHKHKAIISFLLELLDQGDQDLMDVFWSWITRRSLVEVRGRPHARAQRKRRQASSPLDGGGHHQAASLAGAPAPGLGCQENR